MLLCNCHGNSECNCHGLLKQKLGLELSFVTYDKTEGKFIQTPTFPLLSCFMRLEYHNLRGADNGNTESLPKVFFSVLRSAKTIKEFLIESLSFQIFSCKVIAIIRRLSSCLYITINL